MYKVVTNHAQSSASWSPARPPARPFAAARSLVVSREDYAEDRLAHSMMCAFGDDAPESVDLMQYAEVTVRGTVVERFGRAGLDDCEIVTD